MTDGPGWDWRATTPGPDTSDPPIAPPPPSPPGPISAPPTPPPDVVPVQLPAPPPPAPTGADTMSAEEIAEIWRTSREPAGTGLRRSRGPRRFGTAVRAGGLLMLLVTIAIMAMLGAKVLSGLSADATSGAASPASSGERATTPDDGAASKSEDAAPCQLEQRTIQVAGQAYVAITGETPPNLQSLVDEGLLAPLDSGQPRFEVVSDGSTFVVRGVGPCAGT